MNHSEPRPPKMPRVEHVITVDELAAMKRNTELIAYAEPSNSVRWTRRDVTSLQIAANALRIKLERIERRSK